MNKEERVRDCWATPQWLFNHYNGQFNFVMDIAANEHNAKCSRFLTKEDDALTVDFTTLVGKGEWLWCNPPYSNVMPWVEKAIDNQSKGIGTVVLLKNDTSTKWFEKCVENASRIDFLINGRVNFIQPSDDVKASSNNFSSVVIVFGRGDLETRYVDVKQVRK